MPSATSCRKAGSRPGGPARPPPRGIRRCARWLRPRPCAPRRPCSRPRAPRGARRRKARQCPRRSRARRSRSPRRAGRAPRRDRRARGAGAVTRGIRRSRKARGRDVTARGPEQHPRIHGRGARIPEPPRRRQAAARSRSPCCCTRSTCCCARAPGTRSCAPPIRRGIASAPARAVPGGRRRQRDRARARRRPRQDLPDAHAARGLDDTDGPRVAARRDALDIVLGIAILAIALTQHVLPRVPDCPRSPPSSGPRRSRTHAHGHPGAGLLLVGIACRATR